MSRFRIFLLLLIIPFSLNAQILLEKTYSSGATTSNFSLNWVYENIFSNTGKTAKYLTVDNRDFSYKFYNIDHTLYKTKIITPPTGYSLYYQTLFSTKTFNTDEKVEFVVTYSKLSGGITTYSMRIINEDGGLLKDLGNYVTIQPLSGSDGKNRIICTKATVVYTNYPTEYHFEYVYDIYSISGSISAKVSSVIDLKMELPFPNPATSIINLPYTLESGKSTIMRILNLNGQEIEQKIIDSQFKSIELSVNSYKSGIYIYEYNGISNKFIVN